MATKGYNFRILKQHGGKMEQPLGNAFSAMIELVKEKIEVSIQQNGNTSHKYILSQQANILYSERFGQLPQLNIFDFDAKNQITLQQAWNYVPLEIAGHWKVYSHHGPESWLSYSADSIDEASPNI